MTIPYVAPADLFDHLTNLTGFHCDSNKPKRRKRNAVMQHTQTHLCCINEHIHQQKYMAFSDRQKADFIISLHCGSILYFGSVMRTDSHICTRQYNSPAVIIYK